MRGLPPLARRCRDASSAEIIETVPTATSSGRGCFSRTLWEMECRALCSFIITQAAPRLRGRHHRTALYT
jgi:hypothetical protein